MFYYFFLQYKKEIYLANVNPLKLIEILMLSLLIISMLVFSICSMLQVYNIITLSSFLILFLAVVYMVMHIRGFKAQSIVERLEKYKETKVNLLIDLVKKDCYNLYTPKGIDWLINCCNTETSKSSIKISAQGVTFPFVTIAYGVIITSLNLNDILIVTLTFFSLSLTIFILGKIAQPIIDEIIYPDKFKYDRLKEDLEYIKTQI